MSSSISRTGGGSPQRHAWFATFALVAGIGAVASCSATDTGAPDRAPAPPGNEAATPAKAAAAAAARAATVSAPFDLAGVMKQVHFAYRPEGSGFAGGHHTYAVRASAEGVSFTPAAEEGTGAPVRFTTTAIGRGADLRAPSPFAARVEQDGHLAVARGAAIEHLKNEEDGVEQSFAFADRPEGKGDLVVRIRVEGEAWAGVTEGGHHFYDPATGLGVRYGAATFVDARGERTALEVRWTGEELAVVVPEAVVEGAAYPAVIDPTVSAEIGIDTAVPLPGLLDQVTPSVAWDGTNWLVVWNDGRQSGYYYVIGTRVTTSGTILDPGGITITSTMGTSSSKPVVAFDGTNYLVAWEGYDPVNFLGGIYGARVAQTGVVLTGSPFAITTSGTSTAPAIAFNGTEYLVVYTRGSSTSDIYQTRVTMAGTVPNPNGTVISNAADKQSAPAVAWDGTNYFVVWQDRRSTFSYDIYGTRLSSAGAVLDTGGVRDLGGGERSDHPEDRLRRPELPRGVERRPLGQRRHLRGAREPGGHAARRGRHRHHAQHHRRADHPRRVLRRHEPRGALERRALGQPRHLRGPRLARGHRDRRQRLRDHGRRRARVGAGARRHVQQRGRVLRGLAGPARRQLGHLRRALQRHHAHRSAGLPRLDRGQRRVEPRGRLRRHQLPRGLAEISAPSPRSTSTARASARPAWCSTRAASPSPRRAAIRSRRASPTWRRTTSSSGRTSAPTSATSTPRA
ncbi:MAG: hypothetical protein QM820_03380 [Minicystis sp.]